MNLLLKKPTDDQRLDISSKKVTFDESVSQSLNPLKHFPFKYEFEIRCFFKALSSKYNVAKRFMCE